MALQLSGSLFIEGSFLVSGSLGYTGSFNQASGSSGLVSTSSFNDLSSSFNEFSSSLSSSFNELSSSYTNFTSSYNTGSFSGSFFGFADTAVFVQNISMQGTSSATTNVLLSYGVNVITGSNSTDFCAKLPEPVKGKNVIVVNTADYKARIFPSSSAGTLNGVTNGFVEVQPNRLAVNFTCYDNPAPGGWGILSPAGTTANTLTYPILEINHISGSVDSKYFGAYQYTSSAYYGLGTGVYSGSYIPDFTPGGASATYWTTETFPAQITRVRVYTNMVAEDIAPYDGNSQGLKVSWFLMGEGHFTAYNGVTYGPRAEFSMYGYEYSGTKYFYTGDGVDIVPTGGYPVSSPPEIGDAGTLYFDGTPFSFGVGIGPVGNYSPNYYGFFFKIGGAYATKTYKFKVELDYV